MWIPIYVKGMRPSQMFNSFNAGVYPVWLGHLTHLLREAQSHWPPFCFHSQMCKNDTRVAYQKLGCHEIESNISSAYEN